MSDIRKRHSEGGQSNQDTAESDHVCIFTKFFKIINNSFINIIFYK